MLRLSDLPEMRDRQMPDQETPPKPRPTSSQYQQIKRQRITELIIVLILAAILGLVLWG